MVIKNLDISEASLAEFCRRWKIDRLELFGSALGASFGPDSDIDFLYTPAGDAAWGFEFMNAWDELERLVGRKVDLVSRKAVERSRNPSRRRETLTTAKVVYEA
jgi:hypothetical protein